MSRLLCALLNVKRQLPCRRGRVQGHPSGALHPDYLGSTVLQFRRELRSPVKQGTATGSQWYREVPRS